MQIENNILIDDLLQRTEKCTRKVKGFEALTLNNCNLKMVNNGVFWNAWNI